MTTIRATGGQKPACHLLASPLAQPLPSWLLMVPTLISSDPYSRFVRVANLSDEDVLLPARTPVAVLQAIDSVDSTDIQFTVGVSELVVSRETVCRSADSAPADHVPCPDYDGTSSQRKRLQELLTKHAAGFIKDKVRPGLQRSRPPSTPHHRLHSCGPAVQTHTSTPTAGGPRAHQGPAGTECHRRHPQSVCCTSGHRPQERRGNPPLRWLSQAQCKDSWWCLSSSEDPRVFWCAGRGPVLFDSGPGQRLPSNCHASRWHAQDRLRDADGAVRVYQNADGSVISASGLPTPHAVHDVRLHLPVPARVPGRSAGVLQDVWRAPCPPGPSSAAHHRRWSEAEDDKCQFLRRQVHYLGHIISAEGVSCEAGKVKAVKNWPVPATTTTLTSILGFASYYWHFIQGFSKIAGPPHDLVSKGNARHKKKRADISKLSDQQHQKVFEELKAALTIAPVLGFAEFTKPFILETDASHDGLSAILSQDQDEHRRVLAYASRRLRPTEKNQANHSSMKLEFLALKWAITEKFRHYLLGAEFDVFTENNPLVHFRTASLGALEQRWAAQLAQFYFTVKYRPGKSNPADALPRMPPDFHPEASSSPMPPEVVVVQELACEHQSIATAPPPADAPDKAPEGGLPSLSSARLRECQLSDGTISPVLASWPAKPKPQSRPQRDRLQQHPRLFLKDGVLYRRLQDPQRGTVEQLVLPRTLEPDVLASLHDNMGHQGLDRTTELLRARVYWPGMFSEVRSYIHACQRCTMGRKPATNTTLVTSSPHVPWRSLP